MKSFFTKNLILLLLIALAGFLRFYKLGQVPPSLNVDEVSNGYNAYSILKTGRDEYGSFLPLTIRSFGDYNPALSAYTLIPSIKVFGANEFGVRFPSALLGTLTVLLTFFLALALTSSRKIALLATLFLAISPWHLQFSRYDHEANFMVFWSILGLMTLLYGFKKFSMVLLSAVFFGLALNTYQGAKIWVPLFLAIILLWFGKEILKFKKRLILPICIFIFFALPIFLNLKNSAIRAQSVGIFGKPGAYQTFITGYLSHYSPIFLFVAGDSNGRHSVPGMGELYVFEAPLILIGIFYLIRSKSSKVRFILLWLLAAGIPPATAQPTPHALRGLSFIPVWSIIAACGASTLLTLPKSIYKNILLFLLALVAFYNISLYFHLYYSHYSKEKGPDWGDGYKQMVQYVAGISKNYSTIAVTSYFGRPYIYVLWYSLFDPATYQKYSLSNDKFDKFEFFGPSWTKTQPGKAIVVTPPWQAHPDKVLKQIHSTNGDIKFTVSETQQ